MNQVLDAVLCHPDPEHGRVVTKKPNTLQECMNEQCTFCFAQVLTLVAFCFDEFTFSSVSLPCGPSFPLPCTLGKRRSLTQRIFLHFLLLGVHDKELNNFEFEKKYLKLKLQRDRQTNQLRSLSKRHHLHGG